MFITIQLNNRTYKINSEKPLDISIPLNFNGEQPNAYGVSKATSKPCEAGELVGDTRLGGSCNFEQYTFIPHCNGTHTESIGHITKERISIRDCLQDAFIFANLISVKVEKPFEANDTYSVDLNEDDLLITKKSIENSLNTSKFKSHKSDSKALIVRTLPNNESKLNQEYGEYIPPFFSNEAMDYIVDVGVKHLLADLPSIDKIFDEGKLSNHRKFWNIEQGKFEINKNSRINNTITELIYVPTKIKDGQYLLNLQIAAFVSDTSPCRPILFELL